MPPDDRDKAQVEAAQQSLRLAFRVLAQVGILTIGVLLLALFGGQFLDRLLNTERLFTISLLLVSFPASLYIIYRVALSTVAQIPAAGRGRTPRAKEEHDGDDPTAP